MSATKEFTGPINNTRRKADLIDIINALGIKENTGTIKELIPRIQKHLNEHQELAIDSRFQKLFVYRASAVQSTKAESKETGKNSADKSAEDAAAGATGSGKATG
jgi:hypothetical protein